MRFNKLIPLRPSVHKPYIHLRPAHRPRHVSTIRSSESSRRSLESQDSDNDLDFGSYSVILPPEPFVFGTSHIRPLSVPQHISRPPYILRQKKGQTETLHSDEKDEYKDDEEDEFNGDPWEGDGLIKLGSSEEQMVRKAARLARDVLRFAGGLVKEGVTTSAIDASIHSYIISHNAYPSPLRYSGFPKSCCTSVNNVIVHGIPDDRPLEDGDILNIDITVYLDGYHGDISLNFPVGQIDARAQHLIESTTLALEASIAACSPGRAFRDIGRAIHECVEKQSIQQKMCVSTQFTGHGIGKVFHRPPWILHHLNDEPGIMLPGHCFTIEPCVIQGTNPRGWIFPDGWTASTENCARSAQAEHMILITEQGAEVLTR